MRNIPDIMLIVDLEATCWDVDQPPDEQSEIIEIGFCFIDTSTFQPYQPESILVRPQVSRISEFCTDLTSITQEMVNEGVTIQEAFETLRKHYGTKSLVWGSWGEYDREMIESQCEFFNIESPFSNHHINFKALYSTLFNRKRSGLDRAMRHMGISFQGTHHRGVDDAWNVGLVLEQMNRSFNLLEFLFQG